MGIVDILVNNAGLMPRNSFRDGDYRAVQRVMDVNVMSHFWVKLETSNISGWTFIYQNVNKLQTTRIFIGDMIDRHYGHIVAISSMIAFYPMSTTVSYTTSKYAVKGFMDALNRESIHENWGVKTLTVFPHLTNTRKEVIDFMRKKVRWGNYIHSISRSADIHAIFLHFIQSVQPLWKEFVFVHRLKLEKKRCMHSAEALDMLLFLDTVYRLEN